MLRHLPGTGPSTHVHANASLGSLSTSSEIIDGGCRGTINGVATALVCAVAQCDGRTGPASALTQQVNENQLFI